MLSSVAKLADKAFVLGYLLPALLAVYLAINLFGCAPWFVALCKTKAENPFENLTYVALAVWFLGVLLLTVNYWAYRLLEGYLPPVSWLAPLRKWHERRFRSLKAKIQLLDDAGKASEGDKIAWTLVGSYPPDGKPMLPTLFGNTIRAFEYYPVTVYGADGITVWNRLQAVVPASFQALINDARSQVDFFVNICLLSLALALIASAKYVAELFQLHLAAQPADARTLQITVAAALVIAYVAYRWSIGCIGAWGDLMKSAFDCYLPALAVQLGYEPPTPESRRRVFWGEMSQLFIYHERIANGKWNLAKPAAGMADAAGGNGGNDAGDGGDD